MKTLRLAFALCSLLFPVTGVFAQTAAPASPLTTNPVYETNCSRCHGKNGEGRRYSGPSLVSAKAAAIPADHLRSIITNGKGHMPRYTGKLSAEEIDTLVQQIKALNK